MAEQSEEEERIELDPSCQRTKLMLTRQEIERTLAEEANLKRLAALVAVSLPLDVSRTTCRKNCDCFWSENVALKIKHVGKLFFWS